MHDDNDDSETTRSNPSTLGQEPALPKAKVLPLKPVQGKPSAWTTTTLATPRDWRRGFLIEQDHGQTLVFDALLSDIGPEQRYCFKAPFLEADWMTAIVDEAVRLRHRVSVVFEGVDGVQGRPELSAAFGASEEPFDLLDLQEGGFGEPVLKLAVPDPHAVRPLQVDVSLGDVAVDNPWSAVWLIVSSDAQGPAEGRTGAVRRIKSQRG